MVQPFFSVVMPVYNVEAHLEKAVRSVLQQTFPDFELILVDDCSPDGSGEIADRLAAEDERIRVIHKAKNEGQSRARNMALEMVRGYYVLFMDSDDYVDDSLYQDIYATLLEHPAQVLVFGLIEEYYDARDNLCDQVVIRHPAMYCGTQEALRKEIIRLEEQTLYGYVWNKCYQTEHLRAASCRFESMTLNEDLLFNVAYFMNVSSMVILDSAPYHYRKRLEGSLTGRFVPDYYDLHRRRIEAVLQQYEAWELCSDEVRKALGNAYVRYIFSALQRNCDARAALSHGERAAFLKNVLEDPMLKELLPYARGNSRMVRHMQNLLKKRRVKLCLMEGRLIYMIKQRLPALFARAKQSR